MQQRLGAERGPHQPTAPTALRVARRAHLPAARGAACGGVMGDPAGLPRRIIKARRRGLGARAARALGRLTFVAARGRRWAGPDHLAPHRRRSA